MELNRYQFLEGISIWTSKHLHALHSPNFPYRFTAIPFLFLYNLAVFGFFFESEKSIYAMHASGTMQI